MIAAALLTVSAGASAADVSGHGFCFSHDAVGNGGSWTRKLTQGGTDNCPGVCGFCMATCTL